MLRKRLPQLINRCQISLPFGRQINDVSNTQSLKRSVSLFINNIQATCKTEKIFSLLIMFFFNIHLGNLHINYLLWVWIIQTFVLKTLFSLFIMLRKRLPQLINRCQISMPSGRQILNDISNTQSFNKIRNKCCHHDTIVKQRKAIFVFCYFT